VSTNTEILRRAFGSDWGKGKPPDTGDALHPDAELIVPDGMPYGAGVYRGRERIERWFAEDLWQLWAEFSSTPVQLIDGGDTIAVPVRVSGRTHHGVEVAVDNLWVYEFEHGSLRRARLYADTAVLRDAIGR
jgi:ketosteroid isomerase-like protein